MSAATATASYLNAQRSELSTKLLLRCITFFYFLLLVAVGCSHFIIFTVCAVAIPHRLACNPWLSQSCDPLFDRQFLALTFTWGWYKSTLHVCSLLPSQSVLTAMQPELCAILEQLHLLQQQGCRLPTPPPPAHLPLPLKSRLHYPPHSNAALTPTPFPAPTPLPSC